MTTWSTWRGAGARERAAALSVFFTADTHFGHAHILRQRGARYATIAAHDAALVANWNAAVAPDDEVWHLGDFAVASPAYCREIFGRLNGLKRLVVGNHDTNRVLDLPWAASPVESARIALPGVDGGEHRLFLSHYPHRSWPGVWRGRRHLYGHTHASLPDDRLACDVGIDAWADRPARLGEVLARQDAAARLPEELRRPGF